jgi:hypothetical protein
MSNRQGSIKKSNSRSSSASSNNSNFDEQYRDASPISTTTSDSSDDDNRTARDNAPTTPTTPIKCSPFKPNKEISPVSQIPPSLIISHHFPLPSLPSVVVSQSTLQRSAPPEPSASDNILEDFNHFRKMKKRNYWTLLELEALENGMKEFGTQWARILRNYGGDHGPLRNRNAVQLKDKARNEKLRRIKSRLDLGVFYMATGGDDITEEELGDDSNL